MAQQVQKRWSPDNRYDDILFRDSLALQAGELNDIQAMLKHRTGSVFDTIFKDGGIVSGAECVVDLDGGAPGMALVNLSAGYIYLNGEVRKIEAFNTEINPIGVVNIGVMLTNAIITEVEDSRIRDQAAGSVNHGEPGAHRSQWTLSWALSSDAVTGDSEYFSIHNIINGVVIQTAAPPQLDGLTQGLARYDNDAHGSYIVRGMNVVSPPSEDPTKFIYVISEGKAHIFGHEVEFFDSRRIVRDQDPTLERVPNEPHVFVDQGSGNYNVRVNRSPINRVYSVVVTQERTRDIVRGPASGGNDVLPEAQIVRIVAIVQGNTTYTVGTDFVRDGDEVDWSPSGAEPAPNSTYQVTYHVREDVIDDITASITDDGFIINGAVEDSLISVDYDWKMPRIDIIVLDQSGVFSIIKGISKVTQPLIPIAPQGVLSLGSLEHSWRSSPAIINNGIKVVHMREIDEINRQIVDLFDLISLERLRSNANQADPSSKRGVFVDSFHDNDLRDSGLIQTAAIANNVLMLPVDVDIFDSGGVANDSIYFRLQ